MNAQNDELTTLLQTIKNLRAIDKTTSPAHPRVPPPPQLPLMHKFYTPPPPNGFPIVHQSHPAQALAGHPDSALEDWAAAPGYKAVIRIFDYPKITYADHSLPRALLEESIRSIVSHALPSSPYPLCHPPSVNPLEKTPPTVLVTLPSEKAQRTLLRGRIWSSEWITFEALPTTPVLPTAHLAIASFPSDDASYPKKYIKTAWTNPKNARRIAESLLDPREPDLSGKEILDHLVSSLTADPFPLQKRPGYGFVIHAPTWRNDIELWARLRKTLNALDYPDTPKLGQIDVIPLPYCSLCHSANHLRPNCPFPRLPLWSGPSET